MPLIFFNFIKICLQQNNNNKLIEKIEKEVRCSNKKRRVLHLWKSIIFSRKHKF